MNRWQLFISATRWRREPVRIGAEVAYDTRS